MEAQKQQEQEYNMSKIIQQISFYQFEIIILRQNPSMVFISEWVRKEAHHRDLETDEE